MLNIYLVRPLFTVEYTRYMGSIEGAYVSIARQLADEWDLTWWPLWYAGIPYQNTYPPLLHWIVALAARLAHVSPALSYHGVTAFFYCIGPVTLFWMAYRLSGLVWPSFSGALLYSVVSPAALFITAVRNDAGGLFNPRRLQALVVFGEGPHVTSMALVPVAIVALDFALTRRRPAYFVSAALAMAAVVLTNWLGGFALAAAIVAYVLSKTSGEIWKHWLQTVAIGLYSYVIVLPWIPPSTLSVIRTNAQWIGGNFKLTTVHLKCAAILLIVIVWLWSWLERRGLSAHLKFVLLFSFFMGAVTLAAEWFSVFLLPQPQRYHLEMEMAFCLAGVFVFKALLAGLGRAGRRLAVLSFLFFCCLQIKPYRAAARDMARPLDIRTTSEYKTAMWMDRNMNGRRVSVPGSSYFWLNAFTDIPQLAGGFDQGISNPLIPQIQYQLFSGQGAGAREGEIAILWLKAFGVSAVAVSGPQSTEFYKPIRNPKKFEGLLPVLWREGDDVIYQVQPAAASLAHALRRRDHMDRAPVNALDFDFLRSYVAAVEYPEAPRVEMNWRNRHHAVLSGNLRKDHLLLVQVTYHPGWRAQAGGRNRRVSRDSLGLMLVEPECEGPCVVDLEYGDDREMSVARIVSWIGLAAGLSWVMIPWRRVRYWKS